MNRYASFFAAYNASQKRGNPFTKEEVISDFTGGKTASLKDLSQPELNELTLNLNRINGGSSGIPEKYRDTKADKMRKAIIATFYKMNKTPANAIAWAEKQGVRGEKKKFNDYTTGELYILISVAEKIYGDYLKTIRRGI